MSSCSVPRCSQPSAIGFYDGHLCDHHWMRLCDTAERVDDLTLTWPERYEKNKAAIARLIKRWGITQPAA